MVLVRVGGNYVLEFTIRAVLIDIFTDCFRAAFHAAGVDKNVVFARLDVNAVARVPIACFKEVY